LGNNDKFLVGMEQYKIGVAPGRDGALALKARKGLLAPLPSTWLPVQFQSRADALRPNHGQSELQRRDPAPGRKESPVSFRLISSGHGE